MSSILRITDPIPSDTSIDRYEDIEYEPVAGTDLNNNGGDIRLYIETQDIFTHPSKSYLIIEGRLTKANGNSHGDNDVISLTNNAMMYLFRSIRYELSGEVIEKINYPGQATTMLGLLKYPDDFSKSKGLNQLWYKDTGPTAVLNEFNLGFLIRHNYIISSSDPKESFSFTIPLKHIFGFCEDYDKVVYGFKHELTLRRNNDNDAIFKSAAAAGGGGDAVANGKITLSKISWFMPHVTAADKPKYNLYKIIHGKEKLLVGYRMIQCDTAAIPQTTSFSWRLSVKSSPEVPRFIIVGFQTNKNNNQKANLSIFDNVNVSNIYAMLNSTNYPTVAYNISFDEMKFSRVYGDATEFRSKFLIWTSWYQTQHYPLGL